MLYRFLYLSGFFFSNNVYLYRFPTETLVRKRTLDHGTFDAVNEIRLSENE